MGARIGANVHEGVKHMLAAITAATPTLGTDLLAVGGAAIAISAGVYGLKKGWAFFKGLAGK